MASNSGRYCGPCVRIDKTSSPTKWCMDCEESLCGDCAVTHRANKASMSHHVIEMEVASSIAQEDLSYSKQCKLHPDFIIDYFCTFHDNLCCRSCISSEHRTCESVIPLEVAAREVKNSASYRDIIDGIDQVCSTLEIIAVDRENNIQKIKREGDTATQAFSSFKASIVQALDRKENMIISDLNGIRKTSVNKLESEKKEVLESISLMKKYLQKIHFIENNGSCSQLFLLLQDIKTILHEEDVHLNELTNKLETLTIVYNKEDQEAHMSDLGLVEVKSKVCDIQYNPLKCIGAQEMTRPSKTLMASLKFEKKFSYKIKVTDEHSYISGIIVTENGQVVVSSPRESTLQMYNSDGKYIRSCQLAGKPWDISYNYQSKRIVTTLTNMESLQFVDDFEPLPDRLKVPGLCYGVAMTKHNIFVGDINGNLHILDASGKCLKTVKIGDKRLYYVHCDNNKVYVSDYFNNKVHCVQEDGTSLFTFSSPDLKGPDGIATDRNGYVYVVGRRSNNIHRLSSDGTDSEVLLDKADGINDPIALCFDMDYSKMFVSNDKGREVLIFNCKY